MSGSTVSDAQVVAKNIKKFTDRFLDEVNIDMERSRKLLSDRIKQNISLRDHSLRDLAQMGHPYSRRSPSAIHSPEYQVHTQSGDLVSGMFDGIERARVIGGVLKASAFVGIKESVEHAKYVIFGTSKMIPRDFLRGSLLELKDLILSTLSRSLKNTVISFDGEKVKL